MAEITVSAAADRRRQLNLDIASLLNRFTSETGLCVTNVYSEPYGSYGEKSPFYLVKTEISFYPST
jgi:hypothetical protein